MNPKEIFIQYNTIDVDTTDKEFIFSVLSKIIRMNNRFLCLAKIEVAPSSLKGYHVKLYCKKQCDLCRLVFDDDIRYFYDQFREIESRNVLTQTTESFELLRRLPREVKIGKWRCRKNER